MLPGAVVVGGLEQQAVARRGTCARRPGPPSSSAWRWPPWASSLPPSTPATSTLSRRLSTRRRRPRTADSPSSSARPRRRRRWTCARRRLCLCSPGRGRRCWPRRPAWPWRGPCPSNVLAGCSPSSRTSSAPSTPASSTMLSRGRQLSSSGTAPAGTTSTSSSPASSPPCHTSCCSS